MAKYLILGNVLYISKIVRVTNIIKNKAQRLKFWLQGGNIIC